MVTSYHGDLTERTMEEFLTEEYRRQWNGVWSTLNYTALQDAGVDKVITPLRVGRPMHLPSPDKVYLGRWRYFPPHYVLHGIWSW